MGATYSKKEKKNRVYYRFVKPWRHEGSSNNSRSTGRHGQPTLCASELSEDDIWHRGRASDAKCLDETYSVYQGLVKSENVEICRETVLNGFEYTYMEDKETEEYTSNDFQLGNKHKSRPPTHFPHLVHLKNEGVVEREVVVEEEEMYEEPDFKHFNDYPGDIQDIQVQFLQLQLGNKNKNRPQMPLPHRSNLKDKKVADEEEKEEEEMYEDPDFKHFNVNLDNIQDLQLLLGNKYKKLPPIPVHHQSNLKDERVVVVEEEEDKEEMYAYDEPPDFKHCNVYPGNIRTHEVSGDEINVNTYAKAQVPQQPQFEQTQVDKEVNITDTEEEGV